MSTAAKVLIGLSCLAFLGAVFTVLLWPIYNIPAESLSRASNNLVLIAIALLLCCKRNASSA